MGTGAFRADDGPVGLTAVQLVLASDELPESKIARLAGAIRRTGAYRWVGIYEVTGGAIAILGWSGPGAPAHPRFPATLGLCGAAVSTGASIVVGDVTADPRYLTTFGSTRSEIVVPVRTPAGAVLGLIDVESTIVDAFTGADRLFLEHCALLLAGAWPALALPEDAPFSGE